MLAALSLLTLKKATPANFGSALAKFAKKATAIVPHIDELFSAKVEVPVGWLVALEDGRFDQDHGDVLRQLRVLGFPSETLKAVELAGEVKFHLANLKRAIEQLASGVRPRDAAEAPSVAATIASVLREWPTAAHLAHFALLLAMDDPAKPAAKRQEKFKKIRMRALSVGTGTSAIRNSS